MMTCKAPKDLDIKMTSKDGAFWFKVVEDTTKQLDDLKKQLMFLEKVLIMAKDEEAKERQTFNK